MIEALLIATCLSAAESCGPASKAYYAHRPALRRQVRNMKHQILAYTGDWVSYAVPATYLATKSGTAQIKLSKYVSLKLSSSNNVLEFSYGF